MTVRTVYGIQGWKPQLFVVQLLFNLCNGRDSDGKNKINVNTDKKAITTSFNWTELVSDESQTFIQFT